MKFMLDAHFGKDRCWKSYSVNERFVIELSVQQHTKQKKCTAQEIVDILATAEINQGIVMAVKDKIEKHVFSVRDVIRWTHDTGGYA